MAESERIGLAYSAMLMSLFDLLHRIRVVHSHTTPNPVRYQCLRV